MSTEYEATDPQEQKSPEQLRDEIAETREDLGDTVEALAGKTDVKGRAQTRVSEIKANASAKKDELTAKVKNAAPGGGGGDGEATAGTSGSAAADAQDKAREASQQALAFARENPVPVTAAATLLLGYLIGRAVSR